MYALIKWVHVVSATLILGTGLGSAFYLFFINRTRNVAAIAPVARYVVIADWLFTTPAVILQPLTGWYLASLAGIPLTSRWILWTFALYLIAGACWLPVVRIQIRMRDMALAATEPATPLPSLYWYYERVWIVLGVPAFSAMLLAFYLMIAKPV